MKGWRTFRIVAWGLVAVVLVMLMIASYLTMRAEHTNQSGIPAVGKPFRLTSHQGQVVDNASLAGKPYLAFFGFTHCPDICPTTLYELSGMMSELGDQANEFNVIFITVDPERDTPQLLQEYMTSFDPRILALRGSESDTQAAVKAFAAYAQKVPTDGNTYTMDHTAGVYLMDAFGVFRSMLDMHEPQEVRLQKIRNVLDE